MCRNEESQRELRHFVRENMGGDVNALRLKYHGRSFAGFDVEEAITQIECRKKFGKKFSDTLAHCPDFLFPNTLAAEQATSDTLARYHSQLIAPVESVIDLTAGLGIDIFHVARAQRCQCVAVELDKRRFDCLVENSRQLALENFTAINGDCRDVLATLPDDAFDVAFIDPARRGDHGQRVFGLEQCAPDVVAMLPEIMRVARRLIVKMSPMLDVARTIALLPGISRIMAVGTPTECRELVAVVERGNSCNEPVIEAVTLTDSRCETFAFTAAEESAAEVEYGEPRAGDIIVEPTPAVMKVAPRKLFAQRNSLLKLAPNSQVYFRSSADGDSDFGGVDGFGFCHCFRVERVLPYQSKIIKRLAKEVPAAQIACRNFPITADGLRKKLGIKEGEAYRIIATTNAANEPVLVVTRV